MANKTIGQLTQITPSSTTELAIYDGSATGKATVSDLLDTENLVYADDAMSPGSTAELDFESEDTSLTPSSTASVDLLQGTDNWSQRFVKVSQMFKNIRWILKKIGSTDITSLDSNSTLTGAINSLNNNFIAYRNKTYNSERYFKMQMLNYGKSITLQGFNTGNNCGFCIVGAGNNASFYVFTYRPQESRISIQKIGGNNTITIAGTCSTTGTITLTMSASDHLTVFYQGT